MKQGNRNTVTLHIPGVSDVVACNEMINKVGTSVFVIRFQSYHPAEMRDFTFALVLSSQSIWLISYFSHSLSLKTRRKKSIIRTSISRKHRKFWEEYLLGN